MNHYAYCLHTFLSQNSARSSKKQKDDSLAEYVVHFARIIITQKMPHDVSGKMEISSTLSF